VAVSVFNKMVREGNAGKIVEFVERIKDQNRGAAVKKTKAQLEEEQKMADKARIASERANAFLKNRNNAKA